MDKEIWIFHHYASPPSGSGLTRPYEFGSELKRYGYRAVIFTASYLHYSNEQVIEGKKLYQSYNEEQVPFIYIKTSGYQGNGFLRVKNLVDYYINLRRFCKKKKAPDIILASSPHLLSLIAGIRIAGQKKIPCICEIRDLWPDALFYVGRIRKQSVIGRILLAVEHWIYRKADALIFTKEGDIQYLEEKKWLSDASARGVDRKKCFYINNGINMEDFHYNKQNHQLDDPELRSDKFKIIYTGAVRKINNLDLIIEAAAILQKETDILFLIYGTGNRREQLEKRVRDLNLTNIQFKGRIEKKYVPYTLSCASLNLLHYSNVLYNWSRGNSSNKLFEYMAAGKPILSTIEMGYSPIKKYQCGLEVRSPAPETIAAAILKIRNLPEEDRNRMGDNAQRGVLDFDYQVLTKKLLEAVGYVERKNKEKIHH